jgi:hypothetical protein
MTRLTPVAWVETHVHVAVHVFVPSVIVITVFPAPPPLAVTTHIDTPVMRTDVSGATTEAPVPVPLASGVLG